MDATSSSRVTGGGRRRGLGPGLLTVGILLAVGAVLQACSDNKGPAGPSFRGAPVKVVGDAIGGPNGTINIKASVSPGVITRGRRATVEILLTSPGGAPLVGRRVFLSSPGGRFDQASGVSDGNGIFSTTMFVPCEVADKSYAIVAVVEGKSATLEGAFTVVTATTNDPCAGITPTPTGGDTTVPSVSITSSGNANETGPVSATFTVSRTGSTSSALTVSFSIGGSATIGSDYTLDGSGVVIQTTTTGVITISAGATSATMTVTPLADAADAPDPLATNPDAERVVITLTAGTGYSVGSPGVAAIEICDVGSSCS